MEEQRHKRFKRERNQANLNQIMAEVSPRITRIADRVDGREVNSTCIASANEASSSREKRGVVEPWRENTYKRVMTMRTKYTPTLQKLRYMLTAKLKMLSSQGDNSDQREIEKLNDVYKILGRLLSGLNISKDKLAPIHEEGIDDWDKSIDSYLRKVFKRVNTPIQKTISSAPSIPPLVISPGISASFLLKEYNHFQNSLITQTPIQKTIASAPSLPPLVISPKISPSFSLEEHNKLENSLITQTPIQRLINAVSSSSQYALKSAVDDIHSVMRLVDGLEGSGPTPGSRSSLGQDLTGTSSRIGETRRYITSVPTQNPSIEPYSYSNKFLREEIEEVNQKLIDTRVIICEKKDEDMEIDSSGIVIKCVFIGASVNADLKFLILRSRNSLNILVEPLHLLVPTDYPKSSPILLDEFSDETGDDISFKVISKLARYFQGCENPITVSEIARTWDVCVREVIIEFAEKYGGGTFSSRYGSWENR